MAQGSSMCGRAASELDSTRRGGRQQRRLMRAASLHLPAIIGKRQRAMHRPRLAVQVVARLAWLECGEHPVSGVQLLLRARQQEVPVLLDRQRLVRLDEGTRDALVGRERIGRVVVGGQLAGQHIGGDQRQARALA
jgi:hypothetical protein